VSIGGRRQAGLITDDVIAQDTFPEEIQEELLELLALEGARGREFCQQLLQEVKSFLARGGTIAGRWGRIIVRENGDLVVALTQALPTAAASRRA
jgi:hypothetical protein